MVSFDPKTAAIVDKHGKNLLIRSNTLGHEGHFAYHELEKALGINFAHHRFINICMMDCADERKEWSLEFEAFEQNPDIFPEIRYPHFDKGWNPRKLWGTKVKTKHSMRHGAFIWWPISGLRRYVTPPEMMRKETWDFPGLINYMIELFKSPEPTIVAFHCRLGVDRTGVLHAAYLMRNKNYNVEKALCCAGQATWFGYPNTVYSQLLSVYDKMLKERKHNDHGRVSRTNRIRNGHSMEVLPLHHLQ